MRSRRAVADVLIAAAIVAMLALAVAGLASGRGERVDRAAELETRLRCPVCKQVSIQDSPSETAAAMRRLVRAQVKTGRSDEEVVDFFRARYGDWILLDPPAAGRTRWLFMLPAVVAAAGLLVVASRAAGSAPAPEGLDADARARVAASLAALPRRDDEQDEP